MKRYEYGTIKVTINNKQELIEEINKLQCSKILHIENDIPDRTVTGICKRIYFENEYTS